MKALEILKKIYANNPDTRFQRNNIDINFTIHDFSNVNEAIKELEALENRSCESCKKFEQWYCASGIMNVGTCKDEENSLNIFEDNIDNEIPSSFCCNRWKSK